MDYEKLFNKIYKIVDKYSKEYRYEYELVGAYKLTLIIMLDKCYYGAIVPYKIEEKELVRGIQEIYIKLTNCIKVRRSKKCLTKKEIYLCNIDYDKCKGGGLGKLCWLQCWYLEKKVIEIRKDHIRNG